MRNLEYHFDSLVDLAKTLHQGEQELPVPPEERVTDGEWVLVIFEIGAPGKGRATAAAARGVDRADEGCALSFERRDWERLVGFAEAGSITLRAARPLKLAGIASVLWSDSAPSIPPSASPPSSASRLRPMSAAPPPARVLVVDDDHDMRDVVSAMLEAVGLVVNAVSSGEEGLEITRAHGCDLLVLDWNLPGMSGIELCRILRRDPSTQALPVLFLTAHTSSKDVVEAFAAGADDYVAKPFRAPELGARIFGLLRRVRVPVGP